MLPQVANALATRHYMGYQPLSPRRNRIVSAYLKRPNVGVKFKLKQGKNRMSKATQLIRFGRDVRAEISRITWPTWPETQRLTFMVVILAVLVGIYLALVDTAIGAALAFVFGINY